jgi:hypothetical protein
MLTILNTRTLPKNRNAGVLKVAVFCFTVIALQKEKNVEVNVAV